MWNKIYAAFLLAASAALISLAFLAASRLGSLGFPPPAIAGQFESYQGIYLVVFWISGGILLIVANIVLWMRRSAWALWLTLLFLAAFLNLNGWWLVPSLGAYKASNGVPDSGVAIGGLASLFFSAAIAVGIFFDQFIVLRMRDKVFARREESSQAEE